MACCASTSPRAPTSPSTTSTTCVRSKIDSTTDPGAPSGGRPQRRCSQADWQDDALLVATSAEIQGSRKLTPCPSDSVVWLAGRGDAAEVSVFESVAVSLE